MIDEKTFNIRLDLGDIYFYTRLCVLDNNLSKYKNIFDELYNLCDEMTKSYIKCENKIELDGEEIKRLKEIIDVLKEISDNERVNYIINSLTNVLNYMGEI